MFISPFNQILTMKKTFFSIASFVVVCSFLVACGGSVDEIKPAESKAYLYENVALINALKGTWSTNLVKENGVLVYSKASQKDNAVDYDNFRMELKELSVFTLTDKNNTVIEGDWYISDGNVLNLAYEKKTNACCSISATGEATCGDKIISTISFVIAQKPADGEVKMLNKETEYFMKSEKL